MKFPYYTTEPESLGPKIFEWSHKQQIEYFVERMNKMGKTVSDEQIELLKQYLQKSNQPTMIWRRVNKEDDG